MKLLILSSYGVGPFLGTRSRNTVSLGAKENVNV